MFANDCILNPNKPLFIVNNKKLLLVNEFFSHQIKLYFYQISAFFKLNKPVFV